MCASHSCELPASLTGQLQLTGITGKLTGFVTSLTSYFTRHMCHTPINISEVLSYYNDGGDVVWDRGDYITAQRIHLDGDTTIADNIFEYEKQKQQQQQ